MSAEFPARPAPAPTPRPGLGAHLARTFIDGNWFYVLSGILMVIGCHQLVRSMLITGSELIRTSISLGILQAYELLVIATAVIIVRKLRFLGDAFTLFLVESALLLDPTFFSNSLGTISGGRGLWINAACFALCPLKLLILQSMLRVRPSPGAWAAFLGAAAVIYLSPFVHMQKQPALTMHGNYMLLGWALLAVAVLLPPFHRIGGIDEPRPGYASDTQRRWLPRFWAALPLLIAASHYIESARVYTIPFFPAFLAPLLLMATALIANNATRDRSVVERIAYMDLIAAAALLASLARNNIPDVLSMRRPPHAQPTLMLTSWPLVIGALGVCAMFLLLWARSRSAAALWHIAILAATGVVGLIWKSGIIGKALNRGLHGTGRALEFVAQHPAWLLGIATAVALTFALRKFTYIRWFIAGTLSIMFVFFVAPAPPGGLMPEALQAFVILGIVLSHRFGNSAEHLQRCIALFLVLLASAYRFLIFETGWSAAIALTEGALVVAIGVAMHLRTYQWLGAAQFALMGWIYLRMKAVMVPPAVLAIAAGLIMFVVAVVVTFRKAATRHAMEAQPPPEITVPDQP